MDLNADLGELPGRAGEDIDAALLRTVTSANVACGGHAGDPASMRRVCDLAAAHHVAVGAQVSYVDRAGFGRRRLDVAGDVLAAQVRDQLAALAEAARASGTAVSYVKPHGALYHAAAHDLDVAAAVVAAIRDHRIPVLTLPGSRLAQAAEAAGLPAVAEAFADRGYTAGGGLVPRDHPDALVEDPAQVIDRVVGLATRGTVVAVDGTAVRVPAQSICLHGDTPGAVALAAAARAALTGAGVDVTPFTRPGSVPA